MISKQKIHDLRDISKDQTVRRTVFWIACLVAFSARFATGWLVSTDHNQQLGIVEEPMTKAEAFVEAWRLAANGDFSLVDQIYHPFGSYQVNWWEGIIRTLQGVKNWNWFNYGATR